MRGTGEVNLRLQTHRGIDDNHCHIVKTPPWIVVIVLWDGHCHIVNTPSWRHSIIIIKEDHRHNVTIPPWAAAIVL